MRSQKQTAVVYFQMFHLRDHFLIFVSSGNLHCGQDDLKPVEKASFLPLPEPVSLAEMNVHDGMHEVGFRCCPLVAVAATHAANHPVVVKHQVWTPTPLSAKLRLEPIKFCFLLPEDSGATESVSNLHLDCAAYWNVWMGSSRKPLIQVVFQVCRRSLKNCGRASGCYQMVGGLKV